MLTSLAFVFLLGLLLASVFQRLGLPRIIGLLLTGILLGPYALDKLDPTLLAISADLRKMALIIILIKAGLTLDIQDLKKVGRPALLLSFAPALSEILGYTLLAPLFFDLSVTEAAVMGSVLAAVSPAVVVPRMVQLIEDKRGTEKSIPQMILAGASLDDVFVIVLFSTFTGMASGGALSAASLFSIPLSILLGILIGAMTGFGTAALFEWLHRHGHTVRGTNKLLLLLSAAFLLNALESALEGRIPLSGLLAVMSMAYVLGRRMPQPVTRRLSQKSGKIWLAAEILLFVLVGAAVDIRYTLLAGPKAFLLIFLALGIRTIGVTLSLLGTPLSRKERLFCVIAYLPKATVQAAIGSVPLAMGLPCGSLVLSVAVLAILITAPLGAIGIDRTTPRFLQKSDRQ